uniref:Putative transposase strongylocentrotus purpuratus: similar to transposase n=1 Tax=Ixodes ricinus TaxID=34613 RepID=A0A0K8REM1_IXORI
MKGTSHNRELEVGFHLLALFVLASRILCLLRFSFPSGNRYILNPFFALFDHPTALQHPITISFNVSQNAEQTFSPSSLAPR